MKKTESLYSPAIQKKNPCTASPVIRHQANYILTASYYSQCRMQRAFWSFLTISLREDTGPQTENEPVTQRWSIPEESMLTTPRAQGRAFPGGPATVRSPGSHCLGSRFNPWWGNEDPISQAAGASCPWGAEEGADQATPSRACLYPQKVVEFGPNKRAESSCSQGFHWFWGGCNPLGEG